VTGRTGVGDFDYSKTIAYPFGYGLSYTDFSYTDYKVSKSGDDYKVSVTVKNTGTVAGKDAVEVYVQKPYDTYASEN
jgi:beta-glucosidase